MSHSLTKREADCGVRSETLAMKISQDLSSIASAKSHASGKIKNRSFRILRMGSDVFFDADSESPHMT